jgi:adenylate kinase
VVVALPGSGKSTVLKKLSEDLPDIKVVNFGDLMLSEASKIYGISHRDDMRRLLMLDDYRRLQVEAAKRISEIDGLVVVDTHAVIKTEHGLYPGLPTGVVRQINPFMIFFLEPRAEDVLERRMKDNVVRKREITSIEEIARDLEISKQFTVAAANEAMCYLRIIRQTHPQKYPFQHAEEAAREIASAIKTLAKSVRQQT